MIGRDVVVGGWSLPPTVVSQPLGNRVVTLDVNEIAPTLCAANNWIDAGEGILRQRCSAPVETMVGWSTGAIVALGLVGRISPKRLVIISGSLSFCARPGVRSGWPTSMVAAMRVRLGADRAATLREFFVRCGIVQDRIEEFLALSDAYSPGELDAGLGFLLDADLRSVVRPLSCPSVVLHGEEDRIIPPRAGREVADALHGRYLLLRGGHYLFDDPTILDAIIHGVA